LGKWKDCSVKAYNDVKAKVEKIKDAIKEKSILMKKKQEENDRKFAVKVSLQLQEEEIMMARQNALHQMMETRGHREMGGMEGMGSMGMPGMGHFGMPMSHGRAMHEMGGLGGHSHHQRMPHGARDPDDDYDEDDEMMHHRAQRSSNSGMKDKGKPSKQT